MKKCKHKIKKNYPFGRKSDPRYICRRCDKIFKPKDFRDYKQ